MMHLCVSLFGILCVFGSFVYRVEATTCLPGFYPSTYFGKDPICKKCPLFCEEQGQDKELCKEHCKKPSSSISITSTPSTTPTTIRTSSPSTAAPSVEGTTQEPPRIIPSASSSTEKIGNDENNWLTWLIISVVLVIIVALAVMVLFICRKKYNAREKRDFQGSQYLFDNVPVVEV
ncbi:uncharacterized protein LOC124442385 [Xenia sp. Carnegie-2017]|uniref:uncharacterized protein LOC124442385 n=1 Tax=Xenia sp. Carnegie-2017 TaxID=2897299 RepID=UPI001F033096|nr:uncharacterized protein LOC124442385 [Xenia sp. Carnegie-2017]